MSPDQLAGVISDVLLNQVEKNPAPRTITIVCVGPNSYTVMEGERYCDRLCWDEMLGTIAELTHPRIGDARYRMQTPDEIDEQEANRAARIERRRAEEAAADQSMLDTLRQWAAAERADDAGEFTNAQRERDRLIAAATGAPL